MAGNFLRLIKLSIFDFIARRSYIVMTLQMISNASFDALNAGENVTYVHLVQIHKKLMNGSECQLLNSRISLDLDGNCHI